MGNVNKFPEAYQPDADPTKLATYFNDFTKPTDYDTNDWTITETGSGTRAINNTFLGELLITNAAANDDLNSLQLQKETFKFISGKRMYFKVRIKISDATESDFLVGLVITDSTPLTNTDGVYFKKDDGDTNIDFRVNKDSTSSDADNIAAMTTSYIEYAFVYDGDAGISYYIDNVLKGGFPITNMPDDEDLTFTVLIKNGEAVAKTATIDYIYVAQER